MIPLKFYRDDNYVYYNNPNGITKKMAIADFEAVMSGESELPTHTSSNQGEVLSVDANGDLAWKTLPANELPAYAVGDAGKILTVNNSGTGIEWGASQGVDYLYPITVTYNDETYLYTLDKTYAEILAALNSGKFCIGIGTSAPMLVSKYWDGVNSTMYIQFYSFNMALPGSQSASIAMSGIQLAPDDTITEFYKTAN